MAKRNHKPQTRSAAKFANRRRLKVRQSYYYYQFSDFYPRRYDCPEPVPWINIKGYWLNQAGFPIGTVLQVTIKPGRITLSALPDTEDKS